MNRTISSTTQPEIVVLGAGLIGLCAALRLAERGRRVAIIDMHGPLRGTTHTSGSLITANEKRPLAYYELGRASMDAMRELAVEFGGGESWYLGTGHLECATTPETRRRLDGRVAELENLGYPLSRVDTATAMRELEPEFIFPAEAEDVVFFQEDAIIYPHLLAARILRRLHALDVALHFGGGPAEVLRGPRVRLDDGSSLTPEAVLVAGGRWTTEVLRPLGFELPLLSPWGPTPEAFGLQIITTAVPVDIRRMIRIPGISVRPAGGGRLMLHGRPEEAELHAMGEETRRHWDRPLSPVPPQAEALVAKARSVLHNAEGLGLQTAVLSVRALPADGLPVVGPVPGEPRVYAIVAHSGIGLAPVLGSLAAQELSGELAPELAAFRLTRFAEKDWSEQASPMRELVAPEAPTN
jgi:glycine/D-amino acid oxidase-like deaminating enzyme